MVIRKKISGLMSRLVSLWRRLRHPYTPRGFYPTIDSWWAQLSLREQQKHGLRREIFPSQSLNRDLPKTIDSEMYWKFELDYGSVSRPAFVAAIHRGRFWNSSAVITPNNYLLSDTSIYMRIDPENPVQHPVFRHSIPRPVYFDRAIAILSAPGGNSFFHWMIDALPRYELLRQVRDWFDEIDCFIVNDVSHPFQKETLNLLGIPQHRILNGATYPHIISKRLFVPSFVRHQTCNIAPWVFQFLRRELMPKATTNMSPVHKKHRIYISREKAKSRRIVNESEVLNILEKYGFKKVFLESLSITEQMQLFASSEYVIAPHGAGLTNLVFCPQGTKVLEIFSPNYVSVSYWNICNQVGLDYYYLFGRGERSKANQDPHKRLEDIDVNPIEFQKILYLMGLR